jgi:hypothetical protein
VRQGYSYGLAAVTVGLRPEGPSALLQRYFIKKHLLWAAMLAAQHPDLTIDMAIETILSHGSSIWMELAGILRQLNCLSFPEALP